MKKTALTLINLLILTSIFAQTPQLMSYQAVVRDANNELVVNKQVGIAINIIQGSTDGTIVYSESQTATTNANGLLSLEFGSGVDFEEINWQNGPYYIEVNIDPEGGTNYTITAVSQLLSVPYALHAKTVDEVKETQNLNDVLSLGNDAGEKQIKNVLDPVDPQDVATKSYVDQQLELIRLANQGVVDYDGNYYNAVLIGNQIWMLQNLRVTHYPNGDPIPYITDDSEWENLADNNTDDAYCFYNNIESSVYGALYTYSAAIADNWQRDNSSVDASGGQGICPDGWHLPTKEEWEELIEYLGGNDVSGGKMKEVGLNHWESPNEGATNSSGFTALPAGLRYYDSGMSYYSGYRNYIWTANEDENNSLNAYANYLLYDQTTSYIYYFAKSYGFSVRCVKNQ